MVLATGDRQILEEPINCVFQLGGLLDHETRLAVRHFKFRGMPAADPSLIDGEYAEGVRSPLYRCSVFDTCAQGWDDETRLFVERRLEADAGYGKDWLRADPPVILPPWPSYDKLRGRGNQTTAELLAGEVAKLGLDPAEVIEYETGHQNRPAVLEALNALKAAAPEETLIAA